MPFWIFPTKLLQLDIQLRMHKKEFLRAFKLLIHTPMSNSAVGQQMKISARATVTALQKGPSTGLAPPTM